MLPLSVVIIAKNEAKALMSSLPSVKNWAKEIIVVINDCTDYTFAIEKKFLLKTKHGNNARTISCR